MMRERYRKPKRLPRHKEIARRGKRRTALLRTRQQPCPPGCIFVKEFNQYGLALRYVYIRLGEWKESSLYSTIEIGP